MRANLRPLGIVVGLSAVLMAGCADKELAKEVAALRTEITALKADKDGKAAELAKARADNREAIERLKGVLDEATQANQRSEKQIEVLSKNNADLNKITARLDALVDCLPLPHLITWKNEGLVNCKKLEIKDLSITSRLTVDPKNIYLSDDTGAGVMITATGLIAQSKDGYLAAVLTSAEGAELTVLSKNGSYSKSFAAAMATGIKVGGADEDPR